MNRFKKFKSTWASFLIGVVFKKAYFFETWTYNNTHKPSFGNLKYLLKFKFF